MATEPGIQVRQVKSMGETPAEARQRAAEAAAAGPKPPDATGPDGPQGQGEEVAEFTAEHLASIREAEEGFSAPSAEGATVETGEETTEPPSPEKAMDMIRQLSQDKLQLQTELSAALNLVDRYRAAHGDLD